MAEVSFAEAWLQAVNHERSMKRNESEMTPCPSCSELSKLKERIDAISLTIARHSSQGASATSELRPRATVISVSKRYLVEVIETELKEYFCDAYGPTLGQHEVDHIIGGILLRLDGQHEIEANRRGTTDKIA